jgi:soluble lytic murein transglycosylase-like protein
MRRLRESPVRNGLIGLAIAGAAAPVAVTRYQEALRTDSAHERLLTRSSHQAVDDAMVSQAWRAMEAARTVDVDAQRENKIQENLERHREFNISRELAEDIYEAAVKADVDPDVAFGLVRAESSFRNTSTSSVGAIGLTQLMPRTAAWLEPGTTTKDLRDQDTNLRIGFKYLKSLIDKYEGDTKLALIAYNRGPGTVDKVLKRGGNPDNGYADFVYGNENHGHKLFTAK